MERKYWHQCEYQNRLSVDFAGILLSGDLDGRAFDAIRGLSVAEALAVLAELRQTNLEHVSNKSAFLCGLIKTFRQKSKLGNVARNGDTRINSIKPDEAKIKVCIWCCWRVIFCTAVNY